MKLLAGQKRRLAGISGRLWIACTSGQRLVMTGVALAFAGVIAACATTQLKEQWRDPGYRAAATQRVAVIAVTGREEYRRVFEDQFVMRLQREGVEAIPSYSQLSVNGPEDLEAVKAFVGRNGATTVLSVRLMDVHQQTAVSGGYYGPVGYYGYYPYAWTGAYVPPSTYTYRTYMTETRVFDMKSDKMVWAATLQSEEPGNFMEAAAEYVDLVVEQMRANDIIGGG